MAQSGRWALARSYKNGLVGDPKSAYLNIQNLRGVQAKNRFEPDFAFARPASASHDA